MKYLKLLIFLLLLSGFYFGSAYFAVAALAPQWAYDAGLIIWLMGMLGYWYLSRIGRDGWGLPMFLLTTSPFICITAGAIWWVLHLLGLFGF